MSDTAGSLIALVIGAGILMRTVWLVVAACALRRLRRTAVRLEPLPPAIRAAQARVGVGADICVSQHVAGPITFGFRRPVVIVPGTVLSMSGEVQEAIATHELLHVRRRDWLSVVIEEAIRTALWFHPAIWWLIGRIQLTREHVVDHAVIELTQSRDRYVEALLAIAITRKPAMVVPASLFLRRRFLRRRLAHILQETTMTTRRLIASVGVGVGALAVAAVLAVRTFPLEARAALQDSGASASPIQIVKGGEYLLHGALPEYPRRAIQQRVGGDVDIEVAVDDRGEVVDARVLSGPEELRRAALQAVLQWHYSPESFHNASTQVLLRFRVPAVNTEPEEARAETVELIISPAQRAERQMMELEKAMADPAATESQKEGYRQKYAEAKARIGQLRTFFAETRPEAVLEGTPRLSQITSERVPQEVVKEIRERAGISIGDPVTEATIKRIREIVRAFDEHLEVSIRRDARGGIVLMIIAP